MNIKNKLTSEQAQDLYLHALKQVKEDNYRLGQSIFNLLYNSYPYIAEEIRGKEYDMFYKDDTLSIEILFNHLTED